MIRSLMLAATAAALVAGAPAVASPCKDGKGKFVKCEKKPQRCKLGGKFAKCGTPGAKPA